MVKDQGKSYIEKTKLEAAKITSVATEKLEAAKQAEAAAAREREQAHHEKQEAAAIMANAEKYSGLSGKFRAAWDKLKESELIQKIRAEFQKEIDLWKGRARDADERRLEAERKLYEAERRERQARDEALRAGIERDRLRAMLPKSDNSEPDLTLNRSPRLELKPNFSKKKEDENRK